MDKLRRISLIKNVADMMNIEPGDKINYYKEGNNIIITKKGPIIREDFAEQMKKIEESCNKILELNKFNYLIDDHAKRIKAKCNWMMNKLNTESSESKP